MSNFSEKVIEKFKKFYKNVSPAEDINFFAKVTHWILVAWGALFIFSLSVLIILLLIVGFKEVIGVILGFCAIVGTLYGCAVVWEGFSE